MLSGIKQPIIRENTIKTGFGTVDQTVPAPVFCFVVTKIARYFSCCFARQNSNQRDLNTKKPDTAKKRQQELVNRKNLRYNIYDMLYLFAGLALDVAHVTGKLTEI